MEKEFVPYELALRMKQLGFSSPYPIGGYQGGKIFYYEDGELYYDHRPMYSSDAHSGQLLAPLFQQAFRWFRETYQLQGYVYSTTVRGGKDGKCFSDYCWNINGIDLPFLRTDPRDMEKISYQEAELACLEKLIEIVEQSK